MEDFVAKEVLVSEEMANKFKTEKDTPYLRFVRAEGLDIVSAQYIPNLCTVDLKSWPRRGDGAKNVGYDANHGGQVKGTLTRVQQLMVRVIDDGRSALRGLRLSDSGPHDLEEAFHRVPTEVAMGEQVNFRVIAQGKPRPLHSLIRNEVFRIGREAIVNAFRHAHARNIEVEVDYAPRRLRVLVRDDGRGIDPSVLSSGRDGHWGLSGMRERAERIGGCINVSSRKTAGTEVDLSVPGKVAFQIEPSNSRVWLAKLTGKGARKTQSGDGQ